MIKNHLYKLWAIAVMLVALTTQAAEPTGYYNAAEGKSGQALLKALEGIVGNHTTISYDGLWDLYKYSDVGSDGYILDMYSTAKFKPGTNQCGSYSSVGDCYNREHSFPKSWFNDASPMVSDAFHIVPTDGKVNNQRSNYPFGVCANGTYLTGTSKAKPLGKLGKSTYSGYSGTVFEPDDIYKGDFARMYFYMAAAYNSRIASWNSDMLNKTSYPAFSTWAINMLLEWNKLDPVSEKETKRNQAVCDGNGGKYKQNNRNPFVDHPELAEYIWGGKKDQPWYANATQDPAIVAPSSNSTIDFGIVAVNSISSTEVVVKGVNLTEDLELSVNGNGFTIDEETISKEEAMAGKTIKVYYASPATAGTYTATLTIESSETSTVRVPIKATVLTGIPASVTNVGPTSFTARWTNQNDNEYYSLRVYESDGKTLVSGYPHSVKASAQSYNVTGLKPLTTYYLQLTSNVLESNKVEVTTLDVDHIIDILNDGGFSIKATRGQATLPVLEARVYTENVNEAITLTVNSEDNKFDISLDKVNWTNSLTIDSDGEDFFIRLNDVSTTGEFLATLRAYSATYSGDEQVVVAEVVRNTAPIYGDVNDDGEVDIADVNCVVNSVLKGNQGLWNGREDVNGDGNIDVTDINALVNVLLGHQPPTPPAQKETFTEDFEGCENNFGYKTIALQGNTFAWYITDMGVYGGTDKKHGDLSARLGKNGSSKLEMTEDIASGASKVSFYASAWSGDGDVTLSLEASIDGGKSWSPVKSFTITDTQLSQFSTDVNYTGNVRFRFVQTAGKRGNIDDIAITNNPVASAPINVLNADRDWDAVATAGSVMINTTRNAKVAIYDIDANEVASVKVKGQRSFNLPAGTYIVAVGNQSKKVIVK